MAGYAALTGGLLALLLPAAMLTDPERPQAAVVLLFLGALPLLNGAFDFLSLGLTRVLIRRGMRLPWYGTLALGLADLAAALGVFTLLGLALIAHASAMNALAGWPIADLAGLFADLRDPARRWDYVWLWAMIFSTFLPTALHAGIACFSLISSVRMGPRRWVYDLLTVPERDATDNIVVTALLTIMIAVSALLPVVLAVFLGQLVLTAAPGLGDYYLWIFEHAASLLDPSVPDRPAPDILAT